MLETFTSIIQQYMHIIIIYTGKYKLFSLIYFTYFCIPIFSGLINYKLNKIQHNYLDIDIFELFTFVIKAEILIGFIYL